MLNVKEMTHMNSQTRHRVADFGDALAVAGAGEGEGKGQ